MVGRVHDIRRETHRVTRGGKGSQYQEGDTQSNSWWEGFIISGGRHTE